MVRVTCPRHGLKPPCLICHWVPPEWLTEEDPALEVRAEEVIQDRRVFTERWFSVHCVMPLDMRVLWEEIVYRFGQMGVTHENPEVLSGMIVELLCAEWLASGREHDFRYDLPLQDDHRLRY